MLLPNVTSPVTFNVTGKGTIGTNKGFFASVNQNMFLHVSLISHCPNTKRASVRIFINKVYGFDVFL